MNQVNFQDKVFGVVRKIPEGKTLSYKEVAEKAGKPKAWRAVGTVLKTNFDITIPCHRVICSNGETGEYNRGAENKKEILQKEGAIK
jgi:O-6-methylguanine DNA methyltransferase